MSSKNPFLRRLLKEDVLDDVDVSEPPVTDQPEGAPPEDAITDKKPSQVPELAELWHAGQRMDVAARLMFTEVSYADLVDLSFIAGTGTGARAGAHAG